MASFNDRMDYVLELHLEVPDTTEAAAKVKLDALVQRAQHLSARPLYTDVHEANHKERAA